MPKENPDRPVARAGGANGCNCTPPLDARSAWQAMNIIHFIVHILIRTAMRTSACKSTGSRSGIRAMARPFLPKVHLEKGYILIKLCAYTQYG